MKEGIREYTRVDSCRSYCTILLMSIDNNLQPEFDFMKQDLTRCDTSSSSRRGRGESLGEERVLIIISSL